MNHWAAMLAALPPTLQRLVARTQRVSLPRACPPEERARRLRAALCRPAAVRARFATLDAPAREAIELLRARHGGLPLPEAARLLGPIRPLARIADDPRPQSVAEQLLLLGWLVPRAAAPRNPARLMLPPELRRWLPRPLSIATHGPASAPGPAPVCEAAAALLLACARAPLPLRADGSPRLPALAALAPLVAHVAPEDGPALLRFTWGLLRQVGAVEGHAGRGALTLAGERLLAAPPEDRLKTLRAAWVANPHSDAWAAPLRVSTTGIDWPLLRRRLLERAALLPPDTLLYLAEAHAALTATSGPLADAMTHGFRAVRRTPWGQAKAAAVWEAAARGPLAWLGVLAPAGAGTLVFRSSAPRAGYAGAPWIYTAPGVLRVPHGAADRDLLALQPFVAGCSADEAGVIFTLTRASLAVAVAAGQAVGHLDELLRRRAGAPPPGWAEGLELAPGAVTITTRVLVQAEPEALEAAARQRSVRRHMAARLAPGLAVAEPEQAEALARALQRAGLAATLRVEPSATVDETLSPGERAALLVACAFYRQHALPGAPLPPPPGLLARLHAGLPPALRAATDAAIAGLGAVEVTTPAPAPWRSDLDPPAPSSSTGLLAPLRRALAARRLVHLRYRDALGVWSERTVRPLALRQRGELWYLDAFCTRDDAERTFRVDRIAALRVGGLGLASANVVVAGLDGDLADADHLDLAHRRDVEGVEPHAVGVEVDQVAQLAHQPLDLRLRQVALEDAVLHMGAVAAQQLEHGGAALVLDDIVADNKEHKPPPPSVTVVPSAAM